MGVPFLKSWLRFDESATLDSCGSGSVWFEQGDVSLSTDVKLFGSASVHLPSGAYLTANNVIDINADKWTFDAWAYLVSSTDDDGFLALSGSSGRVGIVVGNDGIYVASSGGGSWQESMRGLKFPSIKNQWVHLAIVKDGTTLTFYQGGDEVWSLTVDKIGANNTFILGGSSYGYGNDIYFDEVRFFEGVALWTTNFTPPTAEEYGQEEIPSRCILDIECLVKNYATSWRYENPGDGGYILYHDNITTVQATEEQSVTGVAFWGGDTNNMVDIPEGVKELWIRLDLWLKSSITGVDNTTAFSFGCSTTATSSIRPCGFQNLVWVLPEYSGWSLCIGNTMYATLIPGAINSILIYLRSGATDGILQCTTMGRTVAYNGNVNGGADFANLFFYSSKAAAMYSNIVVSDSPLTLDDGWHREPAAVEFNIKAPDLCVRKNGRTYVIPFSTTNSPPSNAIVARVGRKTVYNPLVEASDDNASPLKVRCNGEDKALSASFD